MTDTPDTIPDPTPDEPAAPAGEPEQALPAGEPAPDVEPGTETLLP